ncbi:glycosyl hydrolase family 5 [Mesorhizobium loti]|uniref:Glycosyl hydrolase family 5 n=1 Tax=Rhizobium loti TaxID=381 RepID=A0A101KWU4_RHILI|nr:glycosyl hydrolase family 5 [Mesorhizobium loti]
MNSFGRISKALFAAASILATSTAAFAAPQAPVAPATSDRVTNPVAEFAGIDKITGRIITFDVYIDETVQFGALQVTPRVCYSRPETEQPKTDSFVEVDEITLDRKIRRIFTGWMFAESPGLNAVEHAVYDVWLKACKQKSDVPPPTAAKADTGKPKAPAQEQPAGTAPEPTDAAPAPDGTDTTDAN